jgi:glycosyltransferase involved in cell wall biosynthesis
MPRPLVTIVSPAYNQERYVAQCIESALAQSYTDWEQIFVDDGSTDGTLDVIARYRDPRIRVIALQHRGLGALAESYNVALSVARGSLVGILEGDDAWPADKLERQVPTFDDPATFLSWGRGALIDAEGRPMRTMTTMKGAAPIVHVGSGPAFHRLTRENFFIPSVTVMVRRSALDAIGGFRQTGSSLFVDLPTWLWLTGSMEGRVTYLDRELGIYRHHASGTSTDKAAQMKLEHLRVVLAVESELGAAALARVGWDAPSRARALARGALVRGKIELRAGRYEAARRYYREALAGGVDLGARMRALRGIVSATSRGLAARVLPARRKRTS